MHIFARVPSTSRLAEIDQTDDCPPPAFSSSTPNSTTTATLFQMSTHTSQCFAVHQRQHQTTGFYLESVYKSDLALEDDSDLTGSLGSDNLLLGGGQTLEGSLLSGGVGGTMEQCHAQEHTEYDGKVVRWGATHFQVRVRHQKQQLYIFTFCNCP